jgi:hypothetical protein
MVRNRSSSDSAHIAQSRPISPTEQRARYRHLGARCLGSDLHSVWLGLGAKGPQEASVCSNSTWYPSGSLT